MTNNTSIRKNKHWSILIESGLLFVLAFMMFTYLYSGTGGKSGGEIGAPGHDSFYHTKMSAMMLEHGLLDTFPWLQYSYFMQEGQGFVSHHYGFHVLMIPFVKLSHMITGDHLPGGRVAICTFFGLVLVFFNLLLIHQKVPYRGIWILLFFLLPSQFFGRHVYIRAISPSLLFMLVLIYFLFKRRPWLAGITIVAYIHLYLGAVMYVPVIVASWALSHVIANREEREWPFKTVIITASFWAVGAITNPYFLGMYEFLEMQVIGGTGLAPAIEVGQEWKPYEGVWWFVQHASLLLSVWTIVLIVRLRLGPHLNPGEATLLLIQFAFLLLTLKARRFIEYWPLFCLLSASYMATPLLSTLRDKLRGVEKSCSVSQMCYLSSVIIIIGLVILIMIRSLYWDFFLEIEMFLFPVIAYSLLRFFIHYKNHDIVHSAHKKVLALKLTQNVVVVLLVFAVSIQFGAASWKSNQKNTRCMYNLHAIRNMMDYIKQQAEPGDIIFTDDWDIFPVFFYHNTEQYFIIGLDPNFTYSRRPDLWERYVRITRGQIPGDYTIQIENNKKEIESKTISIKLEDIRDEFKARYVITDRDHKTLAGRLSNATNFARLIYPESDYKEVRNEPYLVFEVAPFDSVDAKSSGEDNSDDVMYLSDLTPVRSEQGWGSLSNDKTVKGYPLRDNTKIIDKGLGTHAPMLASYNIPEGFSDFKCRAGISRSSDGEGSVFLTISIDGKEKYRSSILSRLDTLVEVELSIEKAKIITLEAHSTEDGNRFDHVDWLEARFIR